MLLAKWWRGWPREQRGKNIWGKKSWDGFGRLIFLPSIFLPQECCLRKFAWLSSGTEGQKDLGQKRWDGLGLLIFLPSIFLPQECCLRNGIVVVLGNRGAKTSGAKKGGRGWGFWVTLSR